MTLGLRDLGFLGASQASLSDPNFSNVVLLLHGDGTNGSATITDSSASRKAITVSGNAQISTAQSRFSGASIAFDGSGDFLTVESSPDWVIGSTGDYTIEAWIYPNGTQASASCIASTYVDYNQTWTNRWLLAVSGSNLQWFDYAGYPFVNSSVLLNQWNHIAVCVRSSGNNTLAFINGSLVYNSSISRSYTNQERLIIGSVPGAGSFNGFIDELRITKGVARYTAAFPVPTAPFPDA